VQSGTTTPIASAPIAKLAWLGDILWCELRNQQVHQQVYDSSAVFGFDVPMTSVPHI
jgi:hypothetical protein